MASQAPTICSATPACRRLNPRETRRRNQVVIPVGVTILFPMTPVKSSLMVRASDPQTEEVSSTTNDSDRAFTSQDDLNYLWKLGAGSTAGAAAIKYGSALFPEITRPNLVEAIIIITSPVIIAIILLIRQSRIER